MAIENDKKPDEILTVFAGFHNEATNQVRKYCLPYPSIFSKYGSF
jgi:putative YphP/YqiW family bacilliredoxin